MSCMPRSANSVGVMCRSFSIWFMVPVLSLALPPGASAPGSPLRPEPAFSLKTISRARFIRALLDAAPCRLAGIADLDRAHLAFDDPAHEVDIQEPVVEPGAGDLDAVGEHEGALELP